jgi:pyrroloquinoline quinone biosynthesis protein B
LKIQVLGSAAGGGFPQWNCNCPQCSAVRAGSLHHRARTQSSIAISSNAQDWLLVNASPDILQQIKAFPQLQPARSLRDSGIAAVMLMDAQIDHTTGLLMLREHKGRLPLWCHPLVKEDLTTGNPLFNVLEYYCGVDLHPLVLDSAFSIPKLSHLKFEAIPLISNAPPYSPHRDQPQPGDNVGLTVADEDTGKTLFYAPGLGQMESHVWSAMQKADCVLVDGTLWTDTEMIDLGASKKTSRAMGHMPQSGPDGMIEWLDKLPSHVRKVLIHINNTNPILNESSPERKTLTEHGIEVAFDGMEITL